MSEKVLMLFSIFFLSIVGFSSQRALYFDGVDDTVSTTGVILTNADWTVEFEFLSETDDGNTRPLIDALPGTAGDGFYISLSIGTTLTVNTSVDEPYASTMYQASQVTIETGRHYVVALTYESATETLTFYINGEQQPSISNVKFPTQTDGRVYFGDFDAYGSGLLFKGFIDDVVFTQALKYTSDYTPDTATPIVDSDTVFLITCEDDNTTTTLTDGSANGTDMTREGDMRTLPYSTPDMTLGWGRFNGLTAIAEETAFAFDTATGFTIEFDIRPEDPSMNSWEAAPRIMGQADNIDEDSDNGFYIYMDYSVSPVAVKVDFHSGGTMSTITIANPVYDEWTRVALVVPAGIIPQPRGYVNGSPSYSSATVIPLTHFNTDTFQIGGMYDIPMARMDLDNVRISDGESYGAGDYKAFPLPDATVDVLAFYDFDSSSGLPTTNTDIGIMRGDEALFGSSMTVASVDEKYYRCNKFLIGEDNWSFDFFMNLDSIGSEMVIWDSHNPINHSGVLMSIDSSGLFHVITGGADQVFSTFTFSTGQDYYVFVGYEESYDSGPGSGTPHLTLFVDGVRVEDQTVGEYTEATDTLFYLGTKSTQENFLDGTLDTFRVSQITRHSPDLSAFIVPEGTTHIDTPVVAQWLFEEGVDASSYADETLNGHDLTQCTRLAFSQYPGLTQSVCEGSHVALVTGSSDSAAQFAWYKDGTLIPGEHSNVLVFPTASLADDGEYRCTIFNDCNLRHGQIIELTVNPGITLNSTFGDGEYCSEEDMTLTVDVSSSSSLTYEWRKNDIVLTGETGASLTISNVQPFDNGTYRCIIETDEACIRSFVGLISVRPYILAVEINVFSCDPNGSSELFSDNICNKPGTISWTGPGSITGETTYTPTVQPGSTGIFFYSAVFTPDDGGDPLVRQVTLTVSDTSIFGTPELVDIWEMAAFWREEDLADYDFAPADSPDGILDIRDMILITNCPDFTFSK